MSDCRVFIEEKTTSGGGGYASIQLWRVNEDGTKRGQYPVCQGPHYAWRDVFAYFADIAAAVKHVEKGLGRGGGGGGGGGAQNYGGGGGATYTTRQSTADRARRGEVRESDYREPGPQLDPSEIPF